MRVEWRSLLFVPADDAVLVAKAARSAADAVILDLEDGVAADSKRHARAALGDAVAAVATDGKDVIVRINAPWTLAIEDLAAAIWPGVAAIMVPKAETLPRLEVLGEMIGELERDRGLEDGSVALIVLVESSRGVLNAAALANAPRTCAIALGSEDFSLNMGVAPSPEILDLPCRTIALAAASAGVAALALPISIAAFRDESGIARAAEAARGWGASGALCVHPTQVRIVNAAFAPSPTDVADARHIAAQWADAVAVGKSVITVDGGMIDAPVAARAHRLLARNRISATSQDEPSP